MNPFALLPKRIPVRNPAIRIGQTVAQKFVNAHEALEYLRNGYKQEFSATGDFIGLIFAPETERPAKLYYNPDDFGPIEIPGLRFIQPPNATPVNHRTVTPFALA